ncbi:MAG: hypothetical protein JWR26_3199, partial [Pedosphaera sp.]|nr:hypothetical protein [Pedosphaera sp.]
MRKKVVPPLRISLPLVSLLTRGILCSLGLLLMGAMPSFAQTLFLDFNTVGQYTNNFNPWNDNATGANAGNYSFAESTTAGVGGNGGVSIFQSSDTTATYNGGSWNFAANGAVIVLSAMIHADGLTSNSRFQFGLINSTTNGLNGNANVAFATYRFAASAANTWSLREQIRTGGTSTETTLGNVTVTSGNWYKFVVSLTNTSGATGNYSSGAAIYDYGTDGLTPGANVVGFSTLRSHTAQDIAKLTSVWPAIRGYQNAGVDVWDNFLVYTPASKPVFTIPLTNAAVAAGTTPTFQALAEGPGTISYAWFTNGVLAAGATTSTYTTPVINNTYTNLRVVASNGNGSTTNSATLTVFSPTVASVTNTPATGIQSVAATLNGQVLSTGGDAPTITLYYGTSNGGTNAGAWANSVSLGVQSGSYAQAISGLNINTTYFYAAKAVNIAGTSWAVPSQSFTTLTPTSVPISVTGFNRDLVVESNALAAGGSFAAYAVELDPGEGLSFYQSGLPGYTKGLPASGLFSSASDTSTLFQFQPYNTNNALLLSTATGLTNGTLTLTTPATYGTISILANSGNGNASGTASVTLNFSDGTSFTTTYAAPDWFNNTPFALAGVERITLANGTLNAGGGSNNPRFYQTTLNLSTLLGATNKPLSSITLGKAAVSAGTAIYAISGQLATNMAPIALTGFNYDLVIENTASGPPFGNYAMELNPGEGTGFYQSGLPGNTTGMPLSGAFTSALGDGTVFQFQPYTTNNALVMSSNTGITNGTLTLVAPATYSSLAILANAGAGDAVGAANVTINFLDGSSFTTTYYAPDWFFNTVNVALSGVGRINITSGAVDGGANNPRFYQSTLDLNALLGATNKPIASLSFGVAPANATAVYAVSGFKTSSTNLSYTVASVTNVPATGLQTTGATLNGQVLSTGGAAPAITIYYGPTNGGTNAGAWANSISLGTQTGNFSTAVSGLSLSTTYFYTAKAVNIAGTSWATPSQSFTTLTPALAVVTNTAASSIQTGSATLNGQVLSTGGDTPSITLYYGTTNGGTNAAAWANNVSLGLQAGSFSQAVSGLLTNTTYYFAAKAVNGGGTSWAAPSQSFATLAPALAVVTNAPATIIQATAATLNGQVLSIGGDTPTVTIYYGTSNGGTNAAAWAQNAALGVQNGVFSLAVPGLATNTTYFFTAKAVNSGGTAWATPSLSFTTLATNPVSTAVAMLTYHNDNARLGANTNETQLTLANVNSNSFGKLFSFAVDGFVYAQPLIMTNVSIPGKGVHNVAYVVTEHESVYAFDADSNLGANASPLWQTSFLGTGVTTVPSGDLGTGDIVPEIGITSTPVIDPATSTIYIEAKTKENGTTYVHRLHALDITTGLERTNFNSPVIIAATNYPGTGSGGSDTDGSGHVVWNPMREHSRPALTLLNGVVYVGFASHGDNGPYHGWLFGYDAHTLAQLGVYNSTPNGGLGGFWQGGGGATVDAAGNFYLMTGNGSFNATTTSFTTSNNLAMSVLKFTPTNGLPKLVDYFSPHDEAALSGGDSDFGSGAAIVLPDSAGSVAHPHLLVAAGKGGRIYLIDRDNMGKFNATADTNVVQVLQNGLSAGGQNGSYATPAFFNNTLYYIGMNDTLRAFPMSGGLISTAAPTQGPNTYGDKGSTSPTISANGTSNAIVWAMENDAYASSGPGVLHAYNATNVAVELYNSNQLLNRDNPGGAIKFTLPSVANGKVYVGAQYTFSVYGAGQFLATPTIAPNGGTFTNSVMVTLTDATPGTSLYYTLDGTTPTGSSILYTGAFAITNSVGLQVIAAKAGSFNSGVASAAFINSSSIGTGTGLSGSYWTATTAAAFSNTNFNTAPTLVRTDATVNFNWGAGSPDPSISADTFTARWTGMVQPQFSQTYTFYTTTDDGVRLWV